ncbi:MAG: S-layer homology domain-containing protein [Clostridia bacterium]|nr:S-layer homology domain-containing protein [Clostridia bacterium]
MKTKKFIAILMSIIMLIPFSTSPVWAENSDANSITAYVTMSKYGQIVTDKNNSPIAYLPVELCDKDSYTLDDLFAKMHELYYDGGKESGYESAVGESGLGIEKLWGDESGKFGYQVNSGNEAVMGLSHVVKNGDMVDVCIYESFYPDTESYTRFDKTHYEAYENESFVLNLSQAEYDENWNTVFSGCENAVITVNGNVTKSLTDFEGNVKLSFDKKGEYIISATKTKLIGNDEVTAITAPVCKVTVSENPKTQIIHNIAAKYFGDNLSTDANLCWFVADMADYAKIYPESKFVANDIQKQAWIDKIIEKATSASKPGDLAKAIIALRALGYDASEVYTADNVKTDIVNKLNCLIDEKQSSVTNVYTLPYVLIALGQSEKYSTQDRIKYLTDSAIASKASWQNTQWGTDGITPMVLALSPYRESSPQIREILEESVDIIKNAQSDTGLINNAPSTGLAIAALSALGTDCENVKKGDNSLTDGLMSQVTDSLDGFKPTTSSFATEQALRGLLAIQLAKSGERIYNFASNPMEPARASWAKNCPVTFNVFPSDATVKVEGFEPIADKCFDLPVGSHNYTVTKSGYKTEAGVITITGEEADVHSAKNVEITLSEAIHIPDNSISITLKVMTHSADLCGNSYTFKNNRNQYDAIVSEKLTLTKGCTVFDALTKALAKNNIGYVESGSGYISSINGLTEFDHGANSGWMYMINKKVIEEGSKEKTLNSDSEIIWFFTDNYTMEDTRFAVPTGTVVSGGSTSGGFSSKDKTDDTTENVLSDSLKYLKKTVSNPTVSSVGGEWTVIALARSDENVDEEFFEKYYNNLEAYVKQKDGVLHSSKYTEYSRVVLALTAIGKNPENVNGYNLVLPLLDFDKTVQQGLNGSAWAMIALDSGNYGNKEIREKYIEYILNREKEKGGWSVAESAKDGDADITAMVLTALAKYKDNEKINSAIKRGLTFLSENQKSDGGYASSETTAQVLTALSSLGILYDDKQFVKNGKTLLDALMKYRLSDGSFAHTAKSDLIATEQCCYALVAMERLKDNKNPLFDMSDGAMHTENTKEILSGKNPDVKIPTITNQGKTFADIASHQSRNAIESLAERGIINGMTDTTFEPDKTMTRAEFTAITVRALGLCGNGEIAFDDVISSDWYFEYVDAAHRYSIVNGVSETKFNPSGTITFEEAATMIERATKLCGIENIHDENSARDILCVYEDYTTISDWAKRSVAFCMEKEIADNSELKLDPQNAVKRGEIAQMLYNMLRLAGVII